MADDPFGPIPSCLGSFKHQNEGIGGFWHARSASSQPARGALATGLGGAVMAFFPRLSRASYDALLGFSAGVMLAAGSITLLGPALRENSMVAVVVGLASGALLVFALERIVPHLEPHFAPELSGPEKRLSLLLGAAITLHHLPDGLAVGVAFAS